jgi:hypothetical protein
MPGYKVEVNTVSDGDEIFTGNAVVHETQEAAVHAAEDLFMRWFAVRKWRVVRFEGEPDTRGVFGEQDGEVVANGP